MVDSVCGSAPVTVEMFEIGTKREREDRRDIKMMRRDRGGMLHTGSPNPSMVLVVEITGLYQRADTRRGV